MKNKLKEIRMKEYMFNQKEFAELLNISQGQYNKYENSISVPTLAIALKISIKLNKNVNEIFSLE